LADSRCTTNSPSLRIVESPSCYVKCRDVDVNKLQELPSGGGIFSRAQGASIVYIYCRMPQVHSYAMEKEGKLKRNREKINERFRALTLVISSIFLSISRSRFTHTRIKIPLSIRFLKCHSIKCSITRTWRQSAFKWTKYRVKYWVIWRDNRIAGSAVKKLTDPYSDRICKTFILDIVHRRK